MDETKAPHNPKLSAASSRDWRKRWSKELVLVFALLAFTGLCLFVTAGSISQRGGRFACMDRCALPAGHSTAQLSPAQAAQAVSRAALCADYECGRISLADYQAGVAERVEPAPQCATRTPATLWAADVRYVSSEYSSDSWSAKKLLGPPDVYPGQGDNANAWASETQDGQVETIMLGFEPAHISGVEVYETYNPGAISQIQVIGVNGERELVFSRTARARPEGSFVQHAQFPCTQFSVKSVQVTVDSQSVPGWNEIDAIGVTPCQ